MERRASPKRFVFVDALRGLAAFAVLFHHATLLPATEAAMPNVVPAFILPLSAAGSLGVQIFFVLSGFVIAHSLRDSSFRIPELGRFMLRRQCRLDPPYWAVLGVILLEAALRKAIPALHSDSLPSFATVVGNAFYLQHLLGLPSMLGVAWTLCLEIQFYLIFLILLRVGRSSGPAAAGKITGTMVHLLFATGVVSLCIAQWPLGYQWFGRYWFYFAAGVLVYWTFQGGVSQSWLLAFIGCYGAAVTWSFFNPAGGTGYLAQEAAPFPLIVGLLTVIALWWTARTSSIFTFGNGMAMQFLGRVSYSLYLTHFLVCSAVLRLGHRLTGTNETAAMLWILGAMVASLLVAQIFFVAIERPSMRLASALKHRPLFKIGRSEAAHASSPVTGAEPVIPN